MRRSQIIEACARSAHEMNRAYCLALGDASQVHWEVAPLEMKDSVRKGVEGALAGNTPEQSHEGWLAHRREHGWVYGPVKDPNAKPPTHPCLVPYAELPEDQRRKDEIFVKTVRTMAHALGYPLPPSKMRYQIWVDEGKECSLLFNLDKDGNIDAASQATIDRHNLRLYESFEGTRDEASKRHDAVSLKEMSPEPFVPLTPAQVRERFEASLRADFGVEVTRVEELEEELVYHWAGKPMRVGRAIFERFGFAAFGPSNLAWIVTKEAGVHRLGDKSPGDAQP